MTDLISNHNHAVVAHFSSGLIAHEKTSDKEVNNHQNTSSANGIKIKILNSKNRENAGIFSRIQGLVQENKLILAAGSAFIAAFVVGAYVFKKSSAPEECNVLTDKAALNESFKDANKTGLTTICTNSAGVQTLLAASGYGIRGNAKEIFEQGIFANSAISFGIKKITTEKVIQNQAETEKKVETVIHLEIGTFDAQGKLTTPGTINDVCKELGVKANMTEVEKDCNDRWSPFVKV